jgi:hypothetical protein
MISCRELMRHRVKRQDIPTFSNVFALPKQKWSLLAYSACQRSSLSSLYIANVLPPVLCLQGIHSLTSLLCQLINFPLYLSYPNHSTTSLPSNNHYIIAPIPIYPQTPMLRLSHTSMPKFPRLSSNLGCTAVTPYLYHSRSTQTAYDTNYAIHRSQYTQ